MQCHSYLATRSAFFPLTVALRHCNHRFSWGIVRSRGFLPLKLAPGMLSSVSTLWLSLLEQQPLSSLMFSLVKPLSISMRMACSCVPVPQAEYSINPFPRNEYVPLLQMPVLHLKMKEKSRISSS